MKSKRFKDCYFIPNARITRDHEGIPIYIHDLDRRDMKPIRLDPCYMELFISGRPGQNFICPEFGSVEIRYNKEDYKIKMGEKNPFDFLTSSEITLISEPDGISMNFSALPTITIPTITSLAALPSIKDVIFNCPATIVLWSDGSKTIVKCMEGDVYDPEHGLAMAILKKLFETKDNPNAYRKVIKPWLHRGIEKIPEQDLWQIGSPYFKDKSERMLFSAKDRIDSLRKGVERLKRQLEESIGKFNSNLKGGKETDG